MGFIKRMFQLSLTQGEIVKSKRFMAILMVPIFVFQMSSLNLVLLQVAIAEDGESASVVVEEPVDEPAPEEEAPAPEEPADDPEKEVQPEEEVEPKEEIVPEDGAKSEEAPVAEEAPSVLDEIVPDSIPEAIVDSAKETPIIPEVVEDEGTENNEGGKITPEAAYDEVEAPTQTPGVEEVKAEEEWKDNNDGSSSIMVTAGNEYEYKDSGLKIRFIRIDNGTGEITVKEIELTDEQVTELGALSNKAWDITSNMSDGTFEYELTLPVEENVDESKVQLVYAEEKEDLNNEEKIKTVEKEDVKVDGEKNELVANGLDHFTIYLVKEKLSNESLVTVASSGSTITNGCMDDLYPGNLVCSANDIDIADVTEIMINDDGCAFPGDTVTFTANWNVEASANERYDVGLYFSTDGDPNNDGAYTGSCSITTLPNSPTPPWFDFDGDFCGDASSSTNVTPTIQQTVQCLDTDGDNKLNLPYCTSWRQNDDDVCNSPLDAFPGAPSKCNCDKGFEIPITVPYGAYIEVVKDLIPSNDGGKFNLQIDGVDKKIDASDSGTTGKVSVGAGTSASPGAMHTVGETSGTGTVLSDYASSISCIDRGLSTFDGGAPLMFSGTGPLNVDVDKDDDIVCTITNSLQQANLTLVKTVTNNNGGTALSTAWTLSASGPTSISGVTGSASITNAPVDIGTYTLSESVGSVGYVASNYSCVKNGGAAVEGNSITLAAGDNVTCTINNDDQSGTLIVKKVVINDNGGTKTAADFKFSVDGGAETSFEADGQNDLTVSAGSYDILEPPVSGYTTTYNNCTDVVVPNGGSATCTITNNDQPASLTVIKHVINDNGGTAIAGDFTMNVTGTNVSDPSFPGVESPGTTVTLNAGSFSVDEGPFSGYTKTTGNNCSGAIANGENKTCTITNDDQPGTLIVKKEITNDNGGNNVCQDFSFNYGTGLINFENDCQNEFSVSAGVYTVTETAAAGYETTYNNCIGISVANGETETCTVYNNDVAPSLTVIKKVINDDGGNETVDAFEIKMNDGLLSFGAGVPNGDTTIYTSNPIVVANTAYTLSEKDLTGYVEGIWSCKTVTGAPVNHPVTLSEGQNVICEITNNDIAPSITLIKEVVNNNGGTAGVNSFGLSVGGTVVNSGQVYPVEANTPYAINEAGLASYEFVSITGNAKCPAALGGTVTLDEGENITCTIKNDDKPGKLTVIKYVVNNDGGNLDSDDFTINVSGVSPSPASFPGSSSGTNITLNAGDYKVTENLIDGYIPNYSADCIGTIAIGENKTCTITNEDQAPKLTLIKTVVNDNGGMKQVADFPLFVGATPVTSGVATTLQSNVEYTVSETNLTGYSASVWSGACSPDGKITLKPGENKTCYITNDDIQPKLTVTKVVNNLTYGNLAVDDFPLFVGATSVVSGIQNGFNVGNYIVSEANKSGYGAVISGDCSANGNITLNPGDVKSCTITNTDNLGKIIIEKQTLPDGDVQLFTFSGEVLGQIADGGILEKIVIPGSYNVSENVPSGWDLTDLDCDDENSEASPTVGNTADINIEANETVKCTFTNTKRSSITIIKDAENNNIQDFEFENDFGNGNPETFYLDDDGINGSVLSNSRTFEVLPGEYEVSEEEVAGWQQESATCDNGETIDSINVEPGENVTCTFVNEEYAKIILVKNTIGGDDTFDFDTTGDGLPADIDLTTVAGTVSQTFENLDQDNTYSIAENTPASWNLTSAICTGGNTPAKITPNAGEVVTCTFTNTKDATLTLEKTVNNDNGGSAEADDFQAKIDGDNVTWGVAQVVSASSHTASEVSLPGYTASSWGGNCAPDGTVTLSPGENKTCTITNDDQQAYVKVIKTVINNNGGDAKPDHFRLTLEGNVVSSDVAVPVNPGAYTAGETLLPGYTFIGFSGDCNSNGDVTVALGETKTCTLTNDDVAPKLTLIKDPTNDNGGNAVPDDFKPTVGGNGVLSGVKNTYAANTPYVINETQLDGYEFVSITGDAKCPATLGGTITLDEGDDITCTISNDDVAPGLTVVKEVKNDNGGNAVVDDFNIELNDNNLTFGTGVVVGTTTTYTATPTITANTDYTISEDDFAGYTEGTWSCTDGTTGIGLNVTVNLDEGEDVICTITNDDVAPTVTLIKEIIGSSADSVNSFGLTIGDATVNSGVKTDVLANTSIALNEAGLAGYTFTSFSGDEGCPSVLGGTVTLEEGEDITCTIINTRDTGSITVNKIIDMDGNLETIEDQVPGANWQFDVNPYTKDTTDASPGSTNDQGSVLFSNLKTGFYAVYESIQPGYDLVKAECNVEYSQFNQEDGVVNVSVSKDGNTICTFYNVPNGTIHGYKWDDINGNRERDCEFEDANEGDFEPSILCEGEDLLPGWTINLYKSNGEGGFDSEPIRTMLTDSGSEHFGWYWFEHLLPGDYKVCEVLQPGWTPTYPFADKDDNCHLVTLPDNIFNGFEGIRNAVDGVAYNFGNQFNNPSLTIAKFNSQWPNIQVPGSVIDYTITVTASENNVNNVKVRDLLPKGFEYVSGSGKASSSLGGGHTGDLVLSHEYASPGEWSLGDMQPGEVVTLNYKAKIADTQEPGNYKDLAWADGKDDKTARVIATSMPAPTIDSGEIDGSDNFVGTQIEMAVAPTPQNVELEEETDTETKTKKKVLGVTTYLPATGTPNGWIMLALAIIIGGAGLMFVSRRRSKNNNLKDLSMKVMLLMIMGMGMIFIANDNIAQAVETIAPNIRLEQPVSPTNDKNLDVGFVVLDIDNRPVTVDCYKKGPSDLAAVKFNTVALPAGGSSGVCAIALDADGNYDLYAMASADGDSSPSNSVSVSLATNTPGTPTNYDRDNEGCTVTFNTANDGGLTKKVVLYRSTEAKFVADNSTKVQEGNFESNVGGSLVDPNGNCDDYFYAIQAVSEAGIGSNFVGDVDVDTETETRTRTVYDETVVYTGGGAIPVTEGQITEGATEEGEVAQEAEGEKAVQGEEAEGELVEGAESEGQVAGIFSEKNSKYWWGVGLIALLSAVYYGYRKYAQKNKKLPFDEE
ncbi:MAG: prealbumin-like fold domain-containing protein [Candidatus Moraniibacteriota bacterium]